MLYGRGAAAEREIKNWLQRSIAPEAICIDAFARIARLIGEHWVEDRCNFLEVTVAVGRLQRLLHKIPSQSVVKVGHNLDAPLLLACAPGEQHTFGLEVLSWMFKRCGWRVHTLAGESAEDRILDEVSSTPYAVVGLSLSTNRKIDALKRSVGRIKQVSKNSDIAVMVGGRVFQDEVSLAVAAGADGWAPTAWDAVVTVNSLTQPRT